MFLDVYALEKLQLLFLIFLESPVLLLHFLYRITQTQNHLTFGVQKPYRAF
jgi:hypothetical protein